MRLVAKIKTCFGVQFNSSPAYAVFRVAMTKTIKLDLIPETTSSVFYNGVHF